MTAYWETVDVVFFENVEGLIFTAIKKIMFFLLNLDRMLTSIILSEVVVDVVGIIPLSSIVVVDGWSCSWQP